MIDSDSSPAEIRDWIDGHDFDQFQVILNAGTEDFRFKVLAALLADTFRQAGMSRAHGPMVVSCPEASATKAAGDDPPKNWTSLAVLEAGFVHGADIGAPVGVPQ